MSKHKPQPSLDARGRLFFLGRQGTSLGYRARLTEPLRDPLRPLADGRRSLHNDLAEPRSSMHQIPGPDADVLHRTAPTPTGMGFKTIWLSFSCFNTGSGRLGMRGARGSAVIIAVCESERSRAMSGAVGNERPPRSQGVVIVIGSGCTRSVQTRGLCALLEPWCGTFTSVAFPAGQLSAAR